MAWCHLRAKLPHDDAPSANGLTAVDLHAAALRVGVATILSGASSLLVRRLYGQAVAGPDAG